MLPEILKPDLTVIFVGAAVTELSETLGFYHLHPKDRFWELLAIGCDRCSRTKERISC
jgi:G:T/U-mismatch repair DNA glycosylase